MAAAASATDAVDELRGEFLKLHPDVAVDTSLAASSSLARQIAAGAEADVFLSASDEWADFLQHQDLVARRRELLGNRLVVVVPRESKLKLVVPADLLGEDFGRLALADPKAVPAGVYARQTLETLRLWKALEPRVAGAANVRQALQFVASGAAEAGIVYASDAAADDNVRVALELDPDLIEPIRYPLVLLERGASNAAAVALFDFLTTPAAARVFARHGFIVLSAPRQQPNRDVPALERGERASWWSPTRDEWLAMRLSFQVGLCAVAASLPLATAVGYFLARSGWRGKWALELVVNLPLVLPPVVTGYLLLMLFAPRGPLGSALEEWLGIRIVFTWIGAAVAAAVVSFPLMVRAIRLAFQGVDPRLEMAARSLGAGRWDAFWTVTLPLARSGLLAGCVLAFARSLGEFGATIMVAGNIVGQTQTIPLAIYSDSNRPGARPKSGGWPRFRSSWRLRP